MIDPAGLRKHLQELLGLSAMPSDIRIPGKVPQLLPFQQPDLSSMSSHELNLLQVAIETQRARQQAGGTNPALALSQPILHSPRPSHSTNVFSLDSQTGPSPGASADARSGLRSLLTRALEELDGSGDGSASAPLGTSTNAYPPEGFAAQSVDTFASNVAAAPAASLPAPTGTPGMFNFSLPPTLLGAAPSSATVAPHLINDPPPADPLTLLAAQAASQQNQRQQCISTDAGSSTFSPARTRQLLTDFYLHLYMFLPVILPPQYMETYVECYSAHRSPFLLALEAILPLLAHDVESEPTEGPDAFNSSSRQMRRRAAARFARQAGDAIDDALEAMEEQVDWDVLLEILQALAVLSIFEYGSSRAVKARIKADQALGLAMSHRMHRMSSLAAFEALIKPSRSRLCDRLTSPVLYEMSKRVWWTTWTVLFYASFNTGKLLTIRADDPRVTSALPAGTGMSTNNEWEQHVSTLRFMLLVQDRVTLFVQSLAPDAKEGWVSPEPPFRDHMTLNSSPSSSSTREHIAESMRSIDKALAHQIDELEKRPLPWHLPTFQGKPTGLPQVEASLSSYMCLMNSGQLYTGWLCLHLYSAFQGASIFERKLCFLKCISDEGHKITPHPTPSAPSEPQVTAPGTAVHELVHTPVPGIDTYGSIFANDTMATGLDPAVGPSGPGWAWGDLDQLTAQLSADMPQPAHTDTTGDWLLRMAGLSPSAGLDGVGAGPVEPSPLGHPSPPPAETDPSPQSQSWMSDQLTKPRGEHPFEARYSLERCVYASKRLLEILGNELMMVNPYLACEHVLTAFTLLIQALSVSNDLGPAADSGGRQTATALLQSAQKSAALNLGYGGSKHGTAATAATPAAAATAAVAAAAAADRQQLLSDIWYHVARIQSTLTRQAQHWDIVIPMAQEVQVCLQTSEMLFDQTVAV